MDAKEVGNTIAKIRKEKSWTQKEIAEKLHVSTAAVSKWERGLNYPDLTLMEPLADLLGITVAELLGLTNEPEDKIIKNITEISQEEKEHMMFSIWKKVSLSFGFVILLFIIAVAIVMIGRNKEPNEMLLSIGNTGLLQIIPLISGVISWGLAFAGILLGREKLKDKWKIYSFLSLVCCSIALYFPNMIMDFNVRRGDFSTIEDTAWGYNCGAIVLLIGTLLFNSLSWRLNKK